MQIYGMSPISLSTFSWVGLIPSHWAWYACSQELQIISAEALLHEKHTLSSISADIGLEGGRGILVPRRFVGLVGGFGLALGLGPLAAMFLCWVPRRFELFGLNEPIKGVPGMFDCLTLY